MKKVYCDNGATSYPKAPLVGETMLDFINNIGCNINRGAYSSSYEAENIVYETRELLCELFDFNKPENVIFTPNITTSLNIVLKGLLGPGDNVIVSSMEHNAVMRPLHSLSKKGITITKVPCNSLGEINVKDIESSITEKTKAVIITHGSNVCGTLLPISEIGQICKDNEVFFIVDSSQGAGVLDINMKDINANAIAFTGHKSLLGPQGIGGFIIDDYLNSQCETLLQGGTGSLSYSLKQPDFLPDKFECGTLNTPGIIGLSAAINYIKSIGINNIYDHNKYLLKYLLSGLRNIPNIKIYGDKSGNNSTTCVSININGLDSSETGYYLDREGIKTRCGLHCSPLAHKTIGTYPNGTVRLSISYFTTKEEINYALSAINKIASNK